MQHILNLLASDSSVNPVAPIMESTKSKSDSGSTVEYTPPASPSGSYYDLSDDDEEEYNTITHSSTGRGVRLLFSKSKVEAPLPSWRSLHALTESTI